MKKSPTWDPLLAKNAILSQIVYTWFANLTDTKIPKNAYYVSKNAKSARLVEGHVPQGVWVQLPPSALILTKNERFGARFLLIA